MQITQLAPEETLALPDITSRVGTVLVTSRSFASGLMDCEALITGAGYAVERGPASHDLSELREPLARAVAWIAGTGPIAEEHLDLAPRLRVISRYGVGVDAVDLAAAGRHGITVTNTPGSNSEAVADHAMALMLAALRRIVDGNNRVRSGDWSATRSRELGALAVGVLGLGQIGRRVVKRLAGFGSTVLGCDPFLSAEEALALGAQPAELRELATRCDVVSLHSPGGQRIIDQTWLAASDRPVLIVNTARADLVDEVAVAAALRSGRVSAYAADTLAVEHLGHDSALLTESLSDRVTITPHFGAQTIEAIDRMGEWATRDVLAVLVGDPPTYPVLVPKEP